MIATWQDNYVGNRLPYKLGYPEGTYSIRIVTQNGANTISVPLIYQKTTVIDVFNR